MIKAVINQPKHKHQLFIDDVLVCTSEGEATINKEDKFNGYLVSVKGGDYFPHTSFYVDTVEYKHAK